MDDTERGVGADFDLLVAIPPDEAGSEPGAFGEAERLAPRAARRWSAGEKARIVRESFWRGERVSDVARRYGLSGKQLSSWRTLAREGKLTLPSSAEQDPEPVAAACEPEGEPPFATLAVDPGPEPDRGAVVSQFGLIGAWDFFALIGRWISRDGGRAWDGAVGRLCAAGAGP